MTDAARIDPESDDGNKDEVVNISKVYIKDPQMVQISLFEIKYFLTTATWARLIMIVGSLLVGGVLSAVFSRIPINSLIVIGSLALFVVGVFLDVYLTRTKLRELERRGGRRWYQH